MDIEEAIPVEPRLEFRPLLLFSGLFFGGFALFFEYRFSLLMSFPDRFALYFLISLSMGVMALSLFMILFFRHKKPCLVMMAFISLVIVMAIGLALLCTTVFATAYNFAILAASAFLLGCGLAAGATLWARAFASLSMRGVLLNSACAYAIVGVVLGVAEHLDSNQALILCATCLFIGSCATLSVLNMGNGMADRSLPSDSEIGEKFDIPVPVFPSLIASIPILGCMLSFFTLGESYLSPSVPHVSTAVVIVIVSALSVAFSFTSLSKKSEVSVTYLLYGIIVPAVAAIAIAIKLIHVDVIDTYFFRDFMFCYFQLLTFSAWTLTIAKIRKTKQSALLSFGATLTVLSGSAIAGMAVYHIADPWNRAILGFSTGAFLLFSVVALSRNLILYSKSTETDSELNDMPGKNDSPLDVARACKIICEQYHLSPREHEVLVELAYGHASSYIAKAFYISNNTARTHMKNIYHKLGVKSRDELLEVIRNVNNQFGSDRR